MSKIDKKLEQIKLQHQIGELLRKDNGVSCHFDYHVNLLSESETVKLNLLTYNDKHDEYMLLHTTKGKSSLDCLAKMNKYLQADPDSMRNYSFTISWRKKGETSDHLSYFWGTSEEAVVAKFLHEKNPDDYSFTAVRNPVA